MKKTLTLLSLSLVLSTSAFARIVASKGEYFVETKKGISPIMKVNEMIQKDAISNIKLYGEGRAHVISFSKIGSTPKLYSVDEKGFIYAIEPFSNYSVTKVDDNGKFQFKELPQRKYVVDAKGFYFY